MAIHSKNAWTCHHKKEQEAERSDQEKESEEEEQILNDTKSQQPDDSEFDDFITNLLFDLENESGELFTSSATNEGDDTSPHFEPSTFLEAPKKVIGDDHSVAFADTNKQDEPDSTLHLRDFHKLFAANKPGAGADRIESQTETIATNKSSPDTLNIDGNMIEEVILQPDKSTKEKEAEPKNTLDKDKIHDIQPKCVSSQEEAAIFGDTPSKKRKAADRSSAEVNKIQYALSSQRKSHIEPSK